MENPADSSGDTSNKLPLLHKTEFDSDSSSSSSRSLNYTILLLVLQWVLYILMWVSFILWIGFIVLMPSHFMRQLLEKTSSTVFGITGSILLLFGVPLVIIAFLGIIYIEISSKESSRRKNVKSPRPRLWTFPALIDGPFGVVSAAEIAVIVLFVAYIFGTMAVYVIKDYRSVGESPLPSIEKWWVMLESSGLHLGSVGLFCLGFLFLPVARGSILLRLIDIPFEHATKYHVWLGHATMALFTAHGLCYLIGWSLEGRLLHEVVQWNSIGIANLPGEISLCAGLAMWATSLRFMRKHYFEVFFYTHQLYIVFVVFLALHVGDFIFCIAAAGILFFVLDRFLRFCQSRKDVGVLSAMCLPCGTVQLVIEKPSGLPYNALSFVFLQIRNLSLLQWHPFSVSSSPYDGRHHLSILIKPLGKWTNELRNMVSRTKEQPQNDLSAAFPFKLNASVEGPYGHQIDYHLSYNNLILVAGGIGISPFVAILRDLLHRTEQGQFGLPRNVLLIWAVKKSKELYILDLVDAECICPAFANKICLELQVYVTQELQPELENGRDENIIHSISNPAMRARPMSSLVGTGNNIWAGIYMISSIIGFVVTMVLTKIFYIDVNRSNSWWSRGLSIILCMVVGVIIFGGLVVVLWNLWEDKISKYQRKINHSKESRETCQTYSQQKLGAGEGMEKLVNPNNTLYGHRPNFD
ncbi:hypothetical protein KI387_031669, partial [Taxus chinensis]